MVPTGSTRTSYPWAVATPFTHLIPRTFGTPRSTWTFAVAAEVCWEQGLTPYQVSLENIRQALKRLGVRWQRAKSWVTSSDPQYARKKSGATASCG
jgi:hypothetical protein